MQKDLSIGTVLQLIRMPNELLVIPREFIWHFFSYTARIFQVFWFPSRTENGIRKQKNTYKIIGAFQISSTSSLF